VDDGFGVRGLERVRRLTSDRQRFVYLQGPCSKAIGECRAFDEFEDKGHDIVTFLERVNRGDVWMVQSREDLRLAPEPSDADRIVSQRRWKHLDCHVSTKLGVVSLVHPAHAAGANPRGDFVFAEASTDQ